MPTRKTESKTREALKAGRPPKEVDLDAIEMLASVGCSKRIICGKLEFSQALFVKRDDIQMAYEKGRACLAENLLRKQVEIALAGNPYMLIHLGKQVCDQQDKTAVEVTGGDSPLVVKHIELEPRDTDA